MKMTTSIRTKLTLTISSLVAVLAMIVAISGSRYFETEFKDSVAKHHFSMLGMAADQLDAQLSTTQSMLAAFASNITTADLGNSHRLANIFEHERDVRQVFDGGLLVLDAAGNIITEWPPHPERVGKNMRFRDYVRTTIDTGKSVISAPYKSGVAPFQPVITFASPLKDQNGRLYGVLAGRHDLLKDNYMSQLGRVSVGESGYLFMFDQQRTMIIHPDRKRLLENIPPGKNRGVDRALAGFEGTLENINSKGIAGITSFRRLKQAPWVIASHYPLAEAYAPIARAKKFFAFTIFIFIATTIGLVWYMARRLATPLLALAEHVRALPVLEGKARHTRLATTDEIGELAKAFNEMVDTLDSQKLQIEENQEIYRFVAESSIELAMLRRVDGGIRYLSPNCEALTGYSAAEFLQDPELFDRIIHPLDAEVWRNHLMQHDEKGQCAAFDLRIISKHGETRWFTHVCHEIRNSDGDLIGNRGSFRDVTPRHELEQEVHNQHQFVKNLLENTSTPLFVINVDHEIIFWNRALVELTGCPADAMVGSRRQWEPFYDNARPTLADLVMSGESVQLNYFYQNIRTDKGLPGTVRAEGWYRQLNGRDRYLFFDAAPVHDASGRLIAVVETLLDITERKLAEESLRLLSEAVEQSASGIVITDTEGTIQYVNSTFCKQTGYSKEEAIGQNPRILKSGRQGPEVYAELWQTITAGRQWYGEFQDKRKDGTLYWELVTISPICREDGSITNFLAVTEDISARKEIEYKLRKQQAELVVKHEQVKVVLQQVEKAKREWEETMDCIDDMVLLTGAKGKILRCNQAVTAFTGKSFLELKDCTWWEVIFTQDMDREQLNGDTGELYHRPSGKWFYLNAYSFKNDTIGNAVVTLHDLTEVKKVSKELSQAYDQLKTTHMQLLQQEKMASIGQLAAGVAHEINNPMGFISSNLGSLGKYTERLKSFIDLQAENIPTAASEQLVAARKKLKIDYVLEDIPKLLAESADGADRVKTIVQNLKSFSRVDESELKEADLNECLDSTVSIAWNELKYKCTVEKDYGDIPPFKCHPQQLNQVFLNLMVNGAHAIEKQGVVSLRTWQEGDEVCIAVSDTGSGIPENIRSRIFEPFFTTKEVGKGTGLGLSISYDIVKKHGGTIDLQSTIGEGTTFTVRLPVGGLPVVPKE